MLVVTHPRCAPAVLAGCCCCARAPFTFISWAAEEDFLHCCCECAEVLESDQCLL